MHSVVVNIDRLGGRSVVPVNTDPSLTYRKLRATAASTELSAATPPIGVPVRFDQATFVLLASNASQVVRSIEKIDRPSMWRQ